MSNHDHNETEVAEDHSAAAATEGDGHAEAEGGAYTEVAHGDAGAAGMPQLEFSTYSNQIFWLVIALVAIYMLLSRVALPRIGSTLEQRASTIQRDLDRAAEMKAKAQEAEEDYQQALVEARAKSLEIAEAAKAEINADLEKATVKADAEIAKQAEKSSARIAEMKVEADSSIGEIATEVAKSLVEKLAPSVSDEQAVSGAVNKVLKG